MSRHVSHLWCHMIVQMVFFLYLLSIFIFFIVVCAHVVFCFLHLKFDGKKILSGFFFDPILTHVIQVLRSNVFIWNEIIQIYEATTNFLYEVNNAFIISVITKQFFFNYIVHWTHMLNVLKNHFSRFWFRCIFEKFNINEYCKMILILTNSQSTFSRKNKNVEIYLADIFMKIDQIFHFEF